VNPLNLCTPPVIDADTDATRSFNCCNNWVCKSYCCFPIFKRKHRKTNEVQNTDEKIQKVASDNLHGQHKPKKNTEALQVSEDDPDEIFGVDKK